MSFVLIRKEFQWAQEDYLLFATETHFFDAYTTVKPIALRLSAGSGKDTSLC